MELPSRVERFLANLPRHDWDKVQVFLGDFAEVRELVNVALLVRTILRRAPQAMIRGRLTSEEFVEGVRRITDTIAALRRSCEDFAVRAAIRESDPTIRSRPYEPEDAGGSEAA